MIFRSIYSCTFFFGFLFSVMPASFTGVFFLFDFVVVVVVVDCRMTKTISFCHIAIRQVKNIFDEIFITSTHIISSGTFFFSSTSRWRRDFKISTDCTTTDSQVPAGWIVFKKKSVCLVLIHFPCFFLFPFSRADG